MTTPPTIQRAVPQLVDLAAAVRADWSERDIRAVIAGAAAIGMTWQQVLVGLARLMVDEQARPAELVPDSRDPLRQRPPAPGPNPPGVAPRSPAPHSEGSPQMAENITPGRVQAGISTGLANGVWRWAR